MRAQEILYDEGHVEVRREARQRALWALRWWRIFTMVLVYGTMALATAACVLTDRNTWPLALFVGAIWFVSPLTGLLRTTIRQRHRRVANWEPIGYRGFPPVPVWTDEQLREAGEAYRRNGLDPPHKDFIPPHILTRNRPGGTITPEANEKKARRLLWSMLDPKQRREYARSDAKFTVLLPPPYHSAKLGDGYILWADGIQQCVHPKGGILVGGNPAGRSLPLTDSVIAQLIHLRNDPSFLYRMR